jgi:hypothetical protein
MSAPVVSTDDYANSSSTAYEYPERLDLDRLRRELSAATSEHPVVVVEGVCLRWVLQELGIAPSIFIYCKRISTAGLWTDDPANYVKGGALTEGLNWADGQSVGYHNRECPLERADIVFSRTEEA